MVAERVDMTVRLLGNRVAITADPVETKSESGIHLPENAQKFERSGTVELVGVGYRTDGDGTLIRPPVEIGDRIVFHRQSGETWTIDGKEYTILQSNEIVAVVS